MASESTSNTNESSNVGIPMEIDNRSTTENTFGLNISPINSYCARNSLDAALFIISNGSYEIPKNYEHPVNKLTKIFESIDELKENPDKMFRVLSEAYYNLYKINLNIITCVNQNYTILNKNNYLKQNDSEKNAFLLFNVNNMVCIPLFTKNKNGNIQTVYVTNETYIWLWMETFVRQINDEMTNSNSISAQNSLELSKECDTGTLVDNSSLSTNLSNSETTAEQTGDVIFEQMLEQLIQLFNALKPDLHSIRATIPISVSNIDNIDLTCPSSKAIAAQTRLSVLSELGQMLIEKNNVTTVVPNTNMNDTVHLNEKHNSVQSGEIASPTISTAQIISSSTSTTTEFSYNEPAIIIEPKEDWYYRYISDLKPRLDKTSGKEKIVMPQLQGVGPEGTKVRVRVPSQQPEGKMYIGIDVCTRNNQDHTYIKILPVKTKIIKELISNENPDGLSFVECDPKHHFEDKTKRIYLEIDENDHQMGYIDIPIYLYKLCQNNTTLTKDIIKNEQLNQCKLVFWFCSLVENEYVPISPVSLSRIITGNENSSSSEDNSDDDGEQEIQNQTLNADVFRVSYNANNDNQDNVRRIVKSKKEKRYEEIEHMIEKLQQAINIRDITQAYECFENLNKVRRIIEKEPKISRSYIQILIQLNDFVNQCWNDRNSYNKTNINHLNILRRYLKQQLISNENINSSSIEQEQSNDVINHQKNEILKKLDEINSMRGTRRINYEKQFESLTIFRQKADSDIDIIIKILLTQIALSLDYHHKNNEYFKYALNYFEELLILLSSKNIETSDDLIALVTRMNEEYIKILQNTDPFSQDYIERLKDESHISSIFDKLKTYFESINQPQHLCTIYLFIIEYMYYKISDQSSIELIDRFCKFIYLNDKLNRTHIRANLCQIYHLALHDYYHKARELMLMYHLQDIIHLSDISTQILYNRTMIQLGFCAFRFGNIVEAYQALVDIQSKYRIKELLGQDIHTMTSLPYHMHINLQLIECICLICAMLIEIPLIGKHRISKYYYHILVYEPIIGPPESIREHIIAASHAMKTGDWNSCVNFLITEKMNTKVWKFIRQAPEILKMLTNKIKEESLRIYLIDSATSFSNISISALVDMFDLSTQNVHSIISKMSINQELIGSIEPLNGIVLIHKTSEIENLSVELMEKIYRLHEQNNFLSKTIY